MTSLLQISYRELCQSEAVDEQWIVDAVEHGVIKPLQGEDKSNWMFSSVDVIWFRKALRLQKDLEIDWISVALIVELLQNNEVLTQENTALRQRLERFLMEDES